jgi:hypothetical protein
MDSKKIFITGIVITLGALLIFILLNKKSNELAKEKTSNQEKTNKTDIYRAEAEAKNITTSNQTTITQKSVVTKTSYYTPLQFAIPNNINETSKNMVQKWIDEYNSWVKRYNEYLDKGDVKFMPVYQNGIQIGGMLMSQVVDNLKRREEDIKKIAEVV